MSNQQEKLDPANNRTIRFHPTTPKPSEWQRFRQKFTPQRPTRFDALGCLAALALIGFGIALGRCA